ncbi:hypothetical protein [Pseudomonas canadensis]|uniref:hypothetical protein n=1 Tax=Pseudomonas canadensis TaxID=915099 RepID=UPI001F46C1B1|nr:hypothetical protein [Pseudomonas canadensis]MCF5170739.1 hypothetical protein [Pseudomonas canadensis]
MLNDYGKDLFKPWLSVSNILLVLAVLFVIALFKLTSSELASWVQAIGSIAAIWGAFAISNSQVERQIQQANQRALDKSNAYFAVVKCAWDHARTMRELVEKQPPVGVFKESWNLVFRDLFNSSLSSLKSLPAYELGNYDLVIFHNGMLAAMSNMSSRVTLFLGADAFIEQELVLMYEDLFAQSQLAEHYWGEYELVFNAKFGNA